MNNKLTNRLSHLREVAKNYQTALAWYQSNIDSPAALQTWDAATAEFMAAIGNRETDIIAYLLDEIDGLRERCKPVVTFYSEGIAAAANWVDQQRESYDNEHGRRDNDTGSFEFGNNAQRDYSDTLAEIAEGIRALHPSRSSSEQETRVAAGGRFTKFNHPELGTTIAVDGEPLSVECVVNSLNTMQAELQRRKADAEPVAYRKFVKDDCNSLLDGYEYFDSQGKSGSREPLYAAPQPAPIVPEIKCDDDGVDLGEFASGWNHCRGFYFKHGKIPHIAEGSAANIIGWNACRAVILQSFGNTEQLNQAPVKQPVSNSENDKFYVTGGTFYPAQQIWPFIFRIGESQLKLNADGTASFEGDTDASARVFFDNVIKLHNHQYRDYERQMSDLRHELDAVKLKDPVSDTNKLPPDEIECDICGFKSTDPDGAHYCCEDNSND